MSKKTKPELSQQGVTNRIYSMCNAWVKDTHPEVWAQIRDHVREELGLPKSRRYSSTLTVRRIIENPERVKNEKR